MNFNQEKLKAMLTSGIIGDVLGSPYEGKSLTENEKYDIADIAENNTRISSLHTDDSQMTIALTYYLSLLENKKTSDITHENVNNYYLKFFSPCKGYSLTTRNIFIDMIVNGKYKSHSSVNNGAVMRIAPIAASCIYKEICKNKYELLYIIHQCLYCTHNSYDAIYAAYIHCRMLQELSFHGNGRQVIPLFLLRQIKKELQDESLYETQNAISMIDNVHNCFDKRQEYMKTVYGAEKFQIKALDLLGCSILCFFEHHSTPRKCIYEAIKLGGDTDTLAKVVGDMVGAYHGDEWHCEKWKKFEGVSYVTNLCDIILENTRRD